MFFPNFIHDEQVTERTAMWAFVVCHDKRSVSSNGSLSIILQEQILSVYQEYIFASFVSHAKSFKFNNKPLVLPLRLLVQSCPDSIERNRKRDNSGY